MSSVVSNLSTEVSPASCNRVVQFISRCFTRYNVTQPPSLVSVLNNVLALFVYKSVVFYKLILFWPCSRVLGTHYPSSRAMSRNLAQKICNLCRQTDKRTDRQKNSTFLFTPAAGEIRAPPNMAW